MHRLSRYLFFLLTLAVPGCVQQLAIRTVSGIIDEYGFSTLNEETDLDLAEKSLASNLKLLEIFLKGDPENRDLLMLLSIGYTSYSLGFVEDDSVDRARVLYSRGREFGLRVLRQHGEFDKAFSGGIDDFTRALRTCSREDLPAVFWTAMGWGSYINLTLTDPDALADLPKVEAMMQFVRRLDSTYYYGGAYLFLGTFYASRPKVLGGNLDLAKRSFDECVRISNGKFLLPLVYYARSYAVQTQNQQLFEELLTKIDTTSFEVLPEARLPNAIAKRKALLLRSKMLELF